MRYPGNTNSFTFNERRLSAPHRREDAKPVPFPEHGIHLCMNTVDKYQFDGFFGNTQKFNDLADT